MQLIILLVVMSLLGAFTIKCMKREDEIIELEDKIIADIRDFLNGRKNESTGKKIEKISGSRENAHGRAA